MLTEPEPLAAIEETYRVLNEPLRSLSVSQEIPPELTAALEQNTFIFSGFKTHHELTEASRLLKDKDGNFKPFQRYLKDVETIDKTYNKNYLRAEYNHAVTSTQMAVKWNEWDQDGDDYDLQYRTAGDDRVRDEHAALDKTTLPPSDPFWDSYLPPNGWNCRCTTVQVRKGKYKRSNSEQAIARGNACTAKPKQQIFRFNPGKKMKVFPDKHPYLPKGCGNCQYKQLAYDPSNAQCQACKAIAKCLNRFDDGNKGKARRKQLKQEAKKFIGVQMANKDFDHHVVISGRNIKEILNQPHKHYNEKNEAILEIDNLFKTSKYKGELKKENTNHNFSSYLFETKINNDESWIIVRKYDLSIDYTIYSISDQEVLLNYLKEK